MSATRPVISKAKIFAFALCCCCDLHEANKWHRMFNNVSTPCAGVEWRHAVHILVVFRFVCRWCYCVFRNNVLACFFLFTLYNLYESDWRAAVKCNHNDCRYVSCLTAASEPVACLLRIVIPSVPDSKFHRLWIEAVVDPSISPSSRVRWINGQALRSVGPNLAETALASR